MIFDSELPKSTGPKIDTFGLNRSEAMELRRPDTS